MTQAIHHSMRPNYSEGSEPVALTQHLLDLIARIHAIVIQFVQTILPFLFKESLTLAPEKVEIVVQNQAPPPPQAQPLLVENVPARAPEPILNQLLPIQRIAEAAFVAPAFVEPAANPPHEENEPVVNNQMPPANAAAIDEPVGRPEVDAQQEQPAPLLENQEPEVRAAAINEPVDPAFQEPVLANPNAVEIRQLPIEPDPQLEPEEDNQQLPVNPAVDVEFPALQFMPELQPVPDDQALIIQVEAPEERPSKELDEMGPEPRKNLLLHPEWALPQQEKPNLSYSAEAGENNAEVLENDKSATTESKPKGDISGNKDCADISELPTVKEGTEALQNWLKSMASKISVSRSRDPRDPILSLSEGIDISDLPAAPFVAIQAIRALGGKLFRNEVIQDKDFQDVLMEGSCLFCEFEEYSDPVSAFPMILGNEFIILRPARSKHMQKIYEKFQYMPFDYSKSITHTPQKLDTPQTRQAANNLAERARVQQLIHGLTCVMTSKKKETGAAILFKGTPQNYLSYAVFACIKGQEPVTVKGRSLDVQCANYAFYLLVPYSHNSTGLVLTKSKANSNQPIGMALYKFNDAAALASFFMKINPVREGQNEGCWLHPLIQADLNRQSQLISPYVSQRNNRSPFQTPSQNSQGPSLGLTTPTPARETVKRTPKTIRRIETSVNSGDIQSQNSLSNPTLILERLDDFADLLTSQKPIAPENLDDILRSIESDESFSLIEDNSFLTNIQTALPKNGFRLINDARFDETIGQEKMLELLPSVAKVHADLLAGAVLTKGANTDLRMYVIFMIKKSETEYKYMVLNPNTEDNKLLLQPLLSESLSYSFGAIDPVIGDEPISITLFKQRKNSDQDDEKTFEKT